ncbi:hypothetical protein BDW75DRAFT_215798 [Aspergillus navahoensis]
MPRSMAGAEFQEPIIHLMNDVPIDDVRPLTLHMLSICSANVYRILFIFLTRTPIFLMLISLEMILKLLKLYHPFQISHYL